MCELFTYIFVETYTPIYMSINDKIKQILIDKNLTPSYFADEIGVQRSSISHILSGRNRPSFDIIQKIIRRFPELGYEWIMEEDNQANEPTTQVRFSHRGNTARSSLERYGSSSALPLTYAAPSATSLRSQRNEIPPVPATPVSTNTTSEQSSTTTSPQQSSTLVTLNDKRVERILMFYTDGSFREFTPTS